MGPLDRGRPTNIPQMMVSIPVNRLPKSATDKFAIKALDVVWSCFTRIKERSTRMLPATPMMRTMAMMTQTTTKCTLGSSGCIVQSKDWPCSYERLDEFILKPISFNYTDAPPQFSKLNLWVCDVHIGLQWANTRTSVHSADIRHHLVANIISTSNLQKTWQLNNKFTK